MKILLLLILHFKSGQMVYTDVTGYVGGSVIILCKYDFKWNIKHTKYFCKLNGKECMDKIISQPSGSWDGERRLFINENEIPVFSVFIKNVSQLDAGFYRCGVDEKGASWEDIELSVKEDSCCGKSLEQNAHRGETVTMQCEYPKEYKHHSKYLYKMKNYNFHPVIYTHGIEEVKERFSLHDNLQGNLFVSIRDVRVDDGGVYLCGAQGRKDQDNTRFTLLFNEIQLQVSDDFTVIISVIVSVCVTLLIIGGLTLVVYRMKHKTQGRSSSPDRKNTVTQVYYEEISEMQSTDPPVYATAQNPEPHSSCV